MSGIREGEQKVIMAKRKVDIDLDYKGLEQCLEGIGRDFQGEGYGLERLFERYRSFHKQGMEPAEGMEALIRSAAELTSKEAPMWEFAAARLRYCQFQHSSCLCCRI